MRSSDKAPEPVADNVDEAAETEDDVAGHMSPANRATADGRSTLGPLDPK
ncbi:MAG: hypothetical protein H0V23_13460 [Nocardioidaceae bacterium]|nr:hypothetical protein [Nocardioidaceae bacterium]